MSTRWFFGALAAMATAASAGWAADHPELKAFPEAEEGKQRFVIVLPHKDRGEEDAFKVELVAGRTILTDGVNLVRLGVEITPRTIEGWGYTYYEVTGKDTVLSTLMAVPEGQPEVEAFVSGAPLLVRYNSRLPIVVYAPAGFEIRYRVWSAPDAFEKAPTG